MIDGGVEVQRAEWSVHVARVGRLPVVALVYGGGLAARERLDIGVFDEPVIVGTAHRGGCYAHVSLAAAVVRVIDVAALVAEYKRERG